MRLFTSRSRRRQGAVHREDSLLATTIQRRSCGMPVFSPIGIVKFTREWTPALAGYGPIAGMESAATAASVILARTEISPDKRALVFQKPSQFVDGRRPSASTSAEKPYSPKPAGSPTSMVESTVILSARICAVGMETLAAEIYRCARQADGLG